MYYKPTELPPPCTPCHLGACYISCVLPAGSACCTLANRALQQGQTSRRRRSLQAGVAVGMYGLRFSAVSTIDESVLAKLRSTFNDFARTVKNPSQGIKVAVPKLEAAVSNVTNSTGTITTGGRCWLVCGVYPSGCSRFWRLSHSTACSCMAAQLGMRWPEWFRRVSRMCACSYYSSA